jgi:bifunctional non-homologous end joining protein LigD
MLLRPGPIPTGDGWAFELKWDGFRTLVSTENGLSVRSRRGWNMTTHVPELETLPRGLVLDGELVAFNEQAAPHWPRLCERVLHGNRSIPVTFVAFDVLRVDGHNVMCNPWSKRRDVLEELGVERSCVRLSEVFDDGPVLFDAVVAHGLEGVVAKKRDGIYRPGYRGWTKIKNPTYWRRDSELELVGRRRARWTSRGTGRPFLNPA